MQKIDLQRKFRNPNFVLDFIFRHSRIPKNKGPRIRDKGKKISIYIMTLVISGKVRRFTIFPGFHVNDRFESFIKNKQNKHTLPK